MAIPLAFVLTALLFDLFFGDKAHDYTNGVNDNLLNIGGILFFLAYVSVVVSIFLYPVWIFMIIRAVKFNRRISKNKNG